MNDEAYLQTISLIKSMNLDYTMSANLTEAMMDLLIEGRTPLAVMAELRELQRQLRDFEEGKRAAEEDKRAAEEDKRAAEEQ